MKVACDLHHQQSSNRHDSLPCAIEDLRKAHIRLVVPRHDPLLIDKERFPRIGHPKECSAYIVRRPGDTLSIA